METILFSIEFNVRIHSVSETFYCLSVNVVTFGHELVTGFVQFISGKNLAKIEFYAKCACT